MLCTVVCFLLKVITPVWLGHGVIFLSQALPPAWLLHVLAWVCLPLTLSGAGRAGVRSEPLGQRGLCPGLPAALGPGVQHAPFPPEPESGPTWLVGEPRAEGVEGVGGAPSTS